MQELWQLYDQQGEPIKGIGATKESVLGGGLLHGAAHVWIWRKTDAGEEVLLQRRSVQKRTFPGMLDISAAGHINLGETPLTAAMREVREEIGIDIDADVLSFVGQSYVNIRANADSIENECRWVYLLRLGFNAAFDLQESEVASIQWMPFARFSSTVLPNNGDYVPQGDEYFRLLLNALGQAFRG